tara:strand:+ start:849 stop:1085 length:237 start_codon:yes stop_codon:yes gene_type:complete
MKQKFNDEMLYNEIENWIWYDKTLFKIYHESGKSIRQISKLTKISATKIYKNLNANQQKINKKFGINYQEYRKQINNK